MRGRGHFRELAVAGSLAAMLAVVLPLQTYVSNVSIYPVSFWRLLPELLVLFVGFASGLLMLLKGLARGGMRDGTLAVMTGLAACLYLESGPFSFGIPELNGGIVPELKNTTRGIVDLCILVGIIVGMAGCVRWIGSILHWIALAFMTLALAALVDVRSTTEVTAAADGGMAAGFISQPTVVANVRYSSGRNVLMFVLDSMPGTDAANLIRTNAALKAKFDGFIAYPRDIGMHECTKRGMPGLVTGRYYEAAEMPQSEYTMTMYGTNSFVTAAVDAGWKVAFSPDLLPFGYTNLPIENRVKPNARRRSRDRLAILRQSSEVPHLSLLDMVVFRVSPFLFKAKILYSRIRHAVRGRHSDDEFWGEKQMYPILVARPVGDDGRPFLGVFHSWGVHPPWKTNFAATAIGKLELLGELLDAYRESGIYDRATIIVTSDHGLDGAGAVDGYPPSASALLWVKPESARGGMRFSDERTSHAGIAELVKRSLVKPVGADEAERVLKSKRRLFRREVVSGGGKMMKDWCLP